MRGSMAPEFTDHDREPVQPDGQDETSDPFHDRPSGPVEGALDVVDRSIGMYLLRRLTGRQTSKPSHSDQPAVILTAEQVAYRIGAAAQPPVAPRTGAPNLDRLTPGGATTVTPRAAGAPRERLVRDSGIALLALVVVGLAVVALAPHGPTGEPTGSVFVVNRAVVTPGPTDEVEAATPRPTGEVAVETDVPASTPGLTVGVTPAPNATPAHGTTATPRPTPRVTLRPGQTPTPTPRPTATPTSNPTATPTPTPTPTETPTETPTPTPTETPTPTPTETPTPSP